MEQQYTIKSYNNLPAPIYIFDEVDSTFETARKLAKENNIPPWSSILATCQMQGRGQLRREWLSPCGNLYATIRLPNEKLFTELTSSAFTGTMIVAAMRQLGFNLFLKWPNDIVMKSEKNIYKVGGILIEENTGIIWAGIGINIYYSPPENLLRKNHAMLASHLSKFVDNFNYISDIDRTSKIQDFWYCLVKESFSWYKSFTNTNKTWIEIANTFLIGQGQNVAFHDDTKLIKGILSGISPTGGIYIENNGVKQEYTNGSLLL